MFQAAAHCDRGDGVQPAHLCDECTGATSGIASRVAIKTMDVDPLREHADTKKRSIVLTIADSGRRSERRAGCSRRHALETLGEAGYVR
jgi:hypothetical protein